MPGTANSNNHNNAGVRVIVFGGKADHGVISPSYTMNTELLEWASLVASGTAPAKRYAHCAAAVGRRMYIFGGCDTDKRMNDMSYLDTENGNVWVKPKIELGTEPSKRSNATLTAVGKRLYLFGGFDGNNYLNDLWEYNTEANTWNEVSFEKSNDENDSAMPVGRAGHSANLIDKWIYVFGGRISMNNRTNELWRLNTEAIHTSAGRIWEKIDCKGNVPSARAAHSSVVVGSQIWIIAGRTDKGLEKDVYILETDNNILIRNETINKGSFYTDGNYIGMIVPPGVFPNPSSKDSMLRNFSLETGEWIEDKKVRLECGDGKERFSGVGSCFDNKNQSVWSYFAFANEERIMRWKESFEALKSEKFFSAESIFQRFGDVMNREVGDKENIDVFGASILILAKLESLGRKYNESIIDLEVSPEVKKNNIASEPFCIELNEECFQILYDLISFFAKKLLSTKEAAAFNEKSKSEAYITIACLRLLHINLYRLKLTQIQPSDVGLDYSNEHSVLHSLKSVLIQLIFSEHLNKFTGNTIRTAALDAFISGF